MTKIKEINKQELQLTMLRLEGSAKLALIWISDSLLTVGALESIANEIFIPVSLHFVVTLLWLVETPKAMDVAIVLFLVLGFGSIFERGLWNKWRAPRAFLFFLYFFLFLSLSPFLLFFSLFLLLFIPVYANRFKSRFTWIIRNTKN